MVWGIIILILWLVGIPVSYFTIINKWENSKFEKIWFSCIWPLLIPLNLIHRIHMMGVKNENKK